MVRFEVIFTNISLTISQHIHFITPIFRVLHITHTTVGSVVEWLKRRARNQHGLGLKPIRVNLLCP